MVAALALTRAMSRVTTHTTHRPAQCFCKRVIGLNGRPVAAEAAKLE